MNLEQINFSLNIFMCKIGMIIIALAPSITERIQQGSAGKALRKVPAHKSMQ